MSGRIWQGVRMRRAVGYADPDGAARRVSLPADWDAAAADALAGLAPGAGPCRIEQAAEGWIGPLGVQARRAGLDLPLATQLHTLLLARRGAPEPAIWQGSVSAEPGFVFNLASFAEPGAGFDLAGFASAAQTATLALSLAAPAARRLRLGVTDLAGLLARLGVAYDSEGARAIAACLATLLRANTQLASSLVASRLGGRASASDWPPPPLRTPVAGLAEAAASAWQGARAARTLRHEALTGQPEAGAADALLGAETIGIGPAFSPLGAEGRLSRAALSWLAAHGLSAEAALAGVLSGATPFDAAGEQAGRAMHAALVAVLERMPAEPVGWPAPMPTAIRRELPARHAGYTQRATLGGHRVFLRTGEYEDGALGELALNLPREGATVRALLDAVAASISAGLQHGVPLAAFADALALTRFGPAGDVEGDPAVRRATSVLDYAIRHLAAHYGGPTVPAADEAAPDLPTSPPETPLLPLDLPASGPSARARRRGLRLVGS